MTETSGILIAFEGIDGTGKSTQLKLLGDFLTAQGYTVVMTREPTNGPYGQKIRELYIDRKKASLDEELELFVSDRRQHVEEVIQPALAAGKIILTDRYYFSTAAYQGAAGCDPEMVFEKNDFAPEPNLTLLLTMEPSIGIDRICNQRGDTLNDFEQQEQLQKVATLFASFTNPGIKRIRADADMDTVKKEIRSVVIGLLKENNCPCLS